MQNPVIREVKAKNILNNSKIPKMSYCINPYIGCAHSCLYCYATFMKEYSGHKEEWGEFIDVKINLGEVLLKEVKKKKIGRVCIGSVSDPYQPIENEKRLTRTAIEILKQNNFPFEILTKSALICRDIDLLKDYNNCSVEITITTIDDNIRKIFEPNADSVENRLNCARKLVDAGIETNIFFGPVLPYFSDTESALDKIFDTFCDTGVEQILVDKLNYPKQKIPVILSKIKNFYPEAVIFYQNLILNQKNYETELRQRILDIAKNKKLNVEVIF
ncbi:MAG: radical SAM protein [candidate division WOR-3 bacterium]|nr:radical SAM protein [candidate division WOR-3 bacterium]